MTIKLLPILAVVIFFITAYFSGKYIIGRYYELPNNYFIFIVSGVIFLIPSITFLLFIYKLYVIFYHLLIDQSVLIFN